MKDGRESVMQWGGMFACRGAMNRKVTGATCNKQYACSSSGAIR